MDTTDTTTITTKAVRNITGRYSVTQWIGIIMFLVTVGGYVYHIEENHVAYEVALNNSIKQRDSIIQVLGIQKDRMDKLEKALNDKIKSDDAKDDADDIRMDNVEKGNAILETRFNDFLYFTKPKK